MNIEIDKSINTLNSDSNKQKYRLLIAEDNHINVKIAQYTLGSLALSIDIAYNGQQAVDMYLQNEYDIIFMDVQMPLLDGYEATIKIREIEKESNSMKRIPIIAMTANSQLEDAEYCIKVGMDAFLCKPFKTTEAKEIVDKLFA